MKNLIIRSLTGIVYVVALVGCTVWNPISSFIFFALVAGATVWEFATVVNNHYGASINRSMSAMAAVILCGTIWEWKVGAGGYAQTLALFGFTMLYIIIMELYRCEEDAIKNWALSFAAQIYIALPFSLIPMISVQYSIETGGLSYEWIYPLSIFIFLWTSDSGAYLVGSLLGRYVPYKLFPRISPNKSWIGSIGGGLLTLAAATIIWHFATNDGTIPGLSLAEWLGLGIVVVVFGTWGDLVESLIKRQLGIKDSGKVLPGHGGLLDRFDSALLAIPAAVIYLTLI